MKVLVCFSHSKKNEGNGWVPEPNMRGYMLYLRKPTEIGKCDLCLQEINVIETIKALREMEP